MKNPTSDRRSIELSLTLKDTRAAQAEFWKSLGKLEHLLGRELASTIDYRDVNLDLLLDARQLKQLR